MSGLILCGKNAKRPYYVSQAEKNVYSLEELQYYVFNNIYLINRDFFTDQLTNFLNDELELYNLAGKLSNMIHKEGDFGEMVILLLSTGSYYNTEELKELERTLKELNSMSSAQRYKTKADGLFMSGKYNSAIKSYAEILSKIGREDDSDEFVASIWNNMAVIYARMFLFKEAYACLKRAGDLNPCTDIMDRLVIAAILSEDAEIIDDLMTQYGITEDELSEYRTALEYQKKHIKTGKEHMKLSGMLSLEHHKDIGTYYHEVGKLADEWKNAYREEVS